MQRSLVMTVLGPDRPGLVRSLADLVAAHGGNWLESSMSRLGGQFAGILRIEVPVEKQADLTAALKGLDSQSLTVVVHADQARPSHPARLNLLEIMGQDRPGIVRQISQALANHGVNVEELRTGCASAAMSGETLFKATAKLSIPDSCNTAELRRELEKIAEDLIVEISLAEVGSRAGV
jgi:glycine cleavage system regulatory protein